MKTDTSSESAIQAFLSHMRAMSRATETIRKHSHILANFHSRLQGRDVFNANTEVILSFLSEKDKSKATLLNRYVTLKHFFRYMINSNRMLVNPILNIDPPKLPKQLPKNVMTRGETERVISVYQNNEDEPTEYRNRLILEIMYACSLRRGEIAALELKDYDTLSQALRISPGKTKTGRLVPIGKQVSDMLLLYIEKLRPESEHPAMFLTRRGKRIGAAMVSLIARDARKQSKIRTKATAHSFRKSSATHMLKNGAPLVSVQALLGHKKATTTEVYTKIYPKDIIQMHKGHHPRERQKNLRLEPLQPPQWLCQGQLFKSRVSIPKIKAKIPLSP